MRRIRTHWFSTTCPNGFLIVVVHNLCSRYSEWESTCVSTHHTARKRRLLFRIMCILNATLMKLTTFSTGECTVRRAMVRLPRMRVVASLLDKTTRMRCPVFRASPVSVLSQCSYVDPSTGIVGYLEIAEHECRSAFKYAWLPRYRVMRFSQTANN